MSASHEAVSESESAAPTAWHPVYLFVVALTSLALLSLQVTATRLLAYRFFYHFVFLVVSLAQLGPAAAGALVYARRKDSFQPQELGRWLAGLAVLVPITLAAYAWGAPRAGVAFAKLDPAITMPYFGLLGVLLVAQNFCGGMVLTLVFSRFRERFGQLYAFDLVGAAGGCLVSVLLMQQLGPVRAFLASGMLAAAAALLLHHFSPTQGRARIGSVLLGVLVTLLVTSWLRPDVFDPNVRYSSARTIERAAWDHLARIDAVMPSRYVIDGDASTDVRENEISHNRFPEYQLARPRPDVAIIGVGAGPELDAALSHQAHSVLAIDVNPTIVRWDLEDDRKTNGGIFHRPGVTVQVDEGRHALRSSRSDFDLIVMYAVDTWTASSQGAYGLTENFLYTTEAIQDMYSKLRPEGIASIRRWLFNPPRETLRLFTTTMDALAREGVARPQDHIVVLAPVPDANQPRLRVWGYVIFSRSPFSAEQLAGLDRAVAADRWSYLFRPGRTLTTPFQQFVDAPDREAFFDEYPAMVRPSRDEAPFFFLFNPPLSLRKDARYVELLYFQSSSVLFVCLFACIVLSTLLLGGPLFMRRRELAREPGLAMSLLYFGGVGAGFIAFELPLIQIMTLFLGHPTYALTVVLLALLASAGAGSFVMGRLPTRTVEYALPLIVVAGLLSAFGLLDMVHALVHLPIALRFPIAAGVTMAIGFILGMPFAGGVRALGARPHAVAWAWACNGAASVLGSCTVMVVMVYAGSTQAFVFAATCYALATVCHRRLATA